MAGAASILRADARTLPLADASVDLIATSPPYFALRSYTDNGEHYAAQLGSESSPREYIATLIECTREWMRVLKSGGSIWVNLGDKYSTGNSGQSGMAALGEQWSGGGHSEAKAKRRSGRVPGVQPKSLLMLPERYRIACVDELGLIARAIVIWSKPNGLPESVKDRVRRSHEDWVHLTKSPKYFSSVDAIREPHVWGAGRSGTVSGNYSNGSGRKDAGTHGSGGFTTLNPLGKVPGSVWSIASQPLKVPAELGIDHFAAFPMEWPRRIILGWSPEGGTVLDPFGGTGTTALVAKALGRNGISIDMSADYCRLAGWRTTDPAQFARAQRPANPPRAIAEPVLDFDASLNQEVGAMAADKEIMKAIERLRLDRPGRAHRCSLVNIIEALRELAATYREEAELWSRSGAKGWKSSEAEKCLVAQHIDDVAAQLDNAGGGAALSVSEREPVGQTEPATTHERLDDFVNSAVAAGKGTLRDVEQHCEDVRNEDVTAYLKGEIDTLPGLTEALVPNSIVRQTDMGNPFASAEGIAEPNPAEHPTAEDGTENPAADPPTAMPKTWESDTLTADGHMKLGVAQTLAPTLGQPGDMGTGYSHTYVPAGGRKVTFAELLTLVPVASLPPHLSHSQGNTIGDCATKYRLQRIEQLPQIPQWANIGGTAFHAAVEAFERGIVKSGTADLDSTNVELAWRHHFEGQITAVAMTTPVPQSVWRAARKGAEGEQWWRVNGPLMLRRYLDARPDDVTWAPVGEQAIELDRTVDVPTPYGPIPYNAKIDRVTISEDGRTLTIRDYKTAYERPTDTTQLGDYAWVLAFTDPGMMAEGIEILGTYFDARRGEWTTPVAVLDVHPFEAFQYRVTTAHAQKLALTTGPTPARPSSYCGGCAVRYACPVMAAKS